MPRCLVAASAFAAVAMTACPALAGQFDGTWVADFPGFTLSGETQTPVNPSCPPMRVVVTIKDNKLSASLERQITNQREVANSNAPEGEPLSGTVKPDGTLTAKWENYTVIGQLAGNTGQVTYRGQCGPRTAQVTRVK